MAEKEIKHKTGQKEKKKREKRKQAAGSVSWGDKVYTVSLVKAFRKPRPWRGHYAVTVLKDYLRSQRKAEEVKIGRALNKFMLKDGVQKPPRYVKVATLMDGSVLKAELVGHKYEEFAVEKVEETSMREKLAEKMRARLGGKAEQKQKEEELIEGKKKEEKEELGE